MLKCYGGDHSKQSILFWDGFASLCRIWRFLQGIDIFSAVFDDSAVYGFVCRMNASAAWMIPPYLALTVHTGDPHDETVFPTQIKPHFQAHETTQKLKPHPKSRLVLFKKLRC